MPSSNKIQKILLLSACAVSLVASGADVTGGGGSGLTGGGGSTIGGSAAGATEKIFHAQIIKMLASRLTALMTVILNLAGRLMRYYL